MDYKEEQQQEVEILESIYPDELTRLSEDEFSINIKLDTESERSHYLKLLVKYPETYPEVVPKLEVEIGELPRLNGDDDDDDEENYDNNYESADEEEEDDENQYLAINLAETIEFNDKDLESLLRKLNEEAQENIGMPSVFALTSLLKDQGEILFNEKLEEIMKRHQEEAAKKEAEEQKKFLGTKVTLESYAEWRNKIRSELGIDKRLQDRFKSMHNGKLTGKEIFEKGLAGLTNEDDIESEMDKLSVK